MNVDKENLVKIRANCDQSWSSAKGFIKEEGLDVSVVLSKQLIKSINESDLTAREKKLIIYFLMAFFTKAFTEVVEEINPNKKKEKPSD